MCDTSPCIRFFVLLIFKSPSFVYLRNSTIVHSSMPVTTRSKARRGLQDTDRPVPPRPFSPTCTNAITSTLEYDNITTISDLMINLPDLAHPSTLSSSSSEASTSSNSSLDCNFENLKISSFEFRFSPTTSSTAFDYTSAQNLEMESDYQDKKVSFETNNSSTSNDEIIKMLTAISTRIVTNCKIS